MRQEEIFTPMSVTHTVQHTRDNSWKEVGFLNRKTHENLATMNVKVNAVCKLSLQNRFPCHRKRERMNDQKSF